MFHIHENIMADNLNDVIEDAERFLDNEFILPESMKQFKEKMNAEIDYLTNRYRWIKSDLICAVDDITVLLDAHPFEKSATDSDASRYMKEIFFKQKDLKEFAIKLKWMRAVEFLIEKEEEKENDKTIKP